MPSKDPWAGNWVPGVLSRKQVGMLVGEYIRGVELEDFENKITGTGKASSIDLRLTGEGYKMKIGSVKPFGKGYKRSFLDNENFAERIKPDSDGHFDLEAKKCYVFRLQESFNAGIYGTNIFGQATAKSSVGRMDVIARLIIDGQYQYDFFDSNWRYASSGDMFIEVIPVSFNVRAKVGKALTQLRLFYGEIESSKITDEEFIKNVLYGSEDGKGYLSVDLSEVSIRGFFVSAFLAKGNMDGNIFLPLWKEKDESKIPDPCMHWKFKKSNQENRLTIEQNQFYILRSKERISLPEGVAVYAKAMDESLGEMRIHYAGFVHPYFGCGRSDGKKGTPLIFEVRGHNIDVNLAHGERLAKLLFYKMSEPAVQENKDEDDKYNKQELELSKYFKDWPKEIEIDDEGNVTSKKEL